MEATHRWVITLALVVCAPMIAFAVPDHHDQQASEIPLVDSQEDYDRMLELMPRANEAVSQYIAESTQSVQRGYEMGFSSFRRWCQQNEQTLRELDDDEVLGRVLLAGFGTTPSGVSGRSSAYMQGLQQMFGSAASASGSPSAGLANFLRAHEQAVQRALSGLSGYAQQFESSHSDVISAARHQLIVELQRRADDSEHSVGPGPATVNVLRQAGVPAPGSATAHAFAQSVLAAQLQAIGGEQGESGAAAHNPGVSDEEDREFAEMESTFSGTVDGRSTCELLGRTRSMDQYLLSPSSPMGPCQRAEMAGALIRICHEIDERMRGWLPGDPPLECMGWDDDDPLGGITTDSAACSDMDPWEAIQAASHRECPEPAPRPRRRGTAPADPLRPEVEWTVQRTNVAVGTTGLTAQEDDFIILRITAPPRDQIRSFDWTMVSAPGGRIVDIQEVNAARSVFQVGRSGLYVVEVLVETRRGRLRPARLEINTAQGPPPPPPPRREDNRVPEAGPSGGSSPGTPCGSNPPPDRWLECGIQDTRRLDSGARAILRAYRDRTLNPGFIHVTQVCKLAKGESTITRHLDEQAALPGNNMVSRVSNALAGRGDGGYLTFVSNMTTLRRGVRLSSNALANSANGCANSLDRSSMVLMDWQRAQQGNPRSVYAIVLR